MKTAIGEKLKWKPWGPKPLRNVIQYILDEVSRRTPIQGAGVLISQEQSGLMISAAGGAGKKGGASANFPFQVLPGQDAFNNAQITVTPGLVGTIVPQMSGLALDHNPPPSLYVGTNPLWLQVFVTLSSNPADYRAVIDPANPPLIFQDATPHVELQMTWTGSPADYSSGIGYFYLKIANIAVDATTHAITLTQYLQANLRSLVLTVDSVLILA